MQRTDGKKVAVSIHRKVQSSTTLNRRYVKRPMRSTDVMVSIKKKPAEKTMVSHFHDAKSDSVTMKSEPIQKASTHPIQAAAIEKMRARSEQSTMTPKKLSAKELKDIAIKKALESAEKNSKAEQKNEKKTAKSKKMHFGFGRVLFAMSCAAAAVFAIVYFVNLNMPDLSLRVAAMQTGIDATYPTYVPRGYNLVDISSENGKIVLNFKNSSDNNSFSLTEERSSWDSNALLTNYVRVEYGDNYSAVKEQGLTIYVNNSNAAWVNGGIVFKIDAENGVLTKKQIRSIATSL